MNSAPEVLKDRTDQHPNLRSDRTDMQPVGQVLAKNTIIIENKALRQGFTQIPNYVLRDCSLSLGARLTYTMLLSYAWQESRCFPGQTRLAADLGVDERSVRRYLVELRGSGYVDWKQQGFGKPNIYYILDIEKRNKAPGSRS